MCRTCGDDPPVSAPRQRRDWLAPFYWPLLLLLAGLVTVSTWAEERLLQWVSDRENGR
jgi:hypothetical protein